MKAEIITITPALAKLWLEQNKNFREPMQSKISLYARDMERGWDENGESIKFNTKDELVDGQNRLFACIKANKPFVSVVVYGVKDDKNVDIGGKRTLAQYLKHHGADKYEHQLAAALRGLSRYRNGEWFSDGPNMSQSNGELLRLLNQNPGLTASVRTTARTWKFLSASIAAPLHYVFSQKDLALADKFFFDLDRGDGLSQDDAVFQLRERLIENKASKLKMNDRQKMALTILAWNYRRAHQSCRVLRWREAGEGRQNFPEIA